MQTCSHKHINDRDADMQTLCPNLHLSSSAFVLICPHPAPLLILACVCVCALHTRSLSGTVSHARARFLLLSVAPYLAGISGGHNKDTIKHRHNQTQDSRDKRGQTGPLDTNTHIPNTSTKEHIWVFSTRLFRSVVASLVASRIGCV